MRYIELFENKEIIDSLEHNKQFQKWFNGSKVVDKNNKPELVFHYSASEKHFDKFKSFSHFGTNKAAEERFDYFYDGDDEITQIGFTVPCFLNIKKPMFIEDFQSSSNMLAYDLYINDKITFEELYNVSNNSFKVLIKTESDFNNIERKYFSYFDFDDKKLVKLLSSKGYDGFCYINEVEDVGSISWIIFNPNQVWRLFSKKED